MNKSERFLLDTSTRNLLKIIYSLGNFVVTWWLVQKLGETGFGIYRSATACVGLLSIASGGMISAAYGMVVEHIAKNDQAKVAAVVWHSFRFLGKIGIVLLICSLPVGCLMAFLYKIPEVDFWNFSLTAAIAAGSLVMGFFSMPFIWVIQARQLEFLSNILHIPLAFLTPLIVVLSLNWKAEPWIPSLSTFLMVCIGNVMCIILSLHLHPWLRKKHAVEINFKEIHSRTYYGLMEQISASLLAQSLAWGITSTKGPAAYGMVAASMTFFSFARDMFSTISWTLIAPIGSIYYSGDHKKSIKIWIEVTCFLSFLSGVLALILSVYNSTLISMWLGPEMSLGLKENVVLAIGFFFSTILYTTSASIYAIGGLKIRAWFFVAECVISIISIWYSSKFYGIFGALLSQTIIQSFFSSVYCLLLFKLFKNFDYVRIFIITIIRIILISLSLFYIYIEIFKNLNSHWLIFIGNIFLQTAIAVIVNFFLGLNSDVRQSILERIREILGKNLWRWKI
ncbi:MAG: hypothetical protein N2035_03320 [Chthoniobacterales bacterium]|nr:hypothetical protein [Chthoniobacterales bacterium]